MAVTTAASSSGIDVGPRQRRLGLDVPAGWWPSTPRLKAWEAAGFGYVQLAIAGELLGDGAMLEAHAAALRERLRLTGLRPIVRAPADVFAGTRQHDAALVGALRYAEAAGSALLVYPARRAPDDSGRALAAEERSLRRLARVARGGGVRIAIQNGAPAYPGRVCAADDPAALARLVERLGCEEVGICLDIAHAHITSGLAGVDLLELVESLLDRVVLFHLHDNFGACCTAQRAGGIEPIRLDLHHAPGAGSVPWSSLAPLLAPHPAPLQLEVHPAQRPAPAALAIVMCELLGLDAPQVLGA